MEFTDVPGICSCNLQSQLETPEQIVNHQDRNWNRRKCLHPRDADAGRAAYGENKNIYYATTVLHHAPRYADVFSPRSTKIRYAGKIRRRELS